MRTTIDIDDTQRAESLRIAAARGDKGFSGVIRDAIDDHLTHQMERQHAVRAAPEVLGVLSDEEAAALSNAVQQVRENWR